MESQRVHVLVNLYGKNYEGELYFGKRDCTFVDLNDCYAFNDSMPLIKCESNGKAFFLYDCDLSNGQIFPKYIVDSYSRSNFSSFEFYLDGVSEWLQSLDDEKEALFRESLKICGVEYSCAAVLKKKKVVITVESRTHQVEFKFIEFITLQFARLFSFLCYNNVTCCGASVWENKKKYPVYSFLFNDSGHKLDCRYSLLSARLIHNDNLWPVILENYFEKKANLFECCLNNFWGQIKFEGYWEYEFLGLFAILDKYTGMTNVGKSAKAFSAKSVDSAIRRVKDFIASLAGLNDEEKMIFSGLPRKIQNMNRWNAWNSVKSRIHYLLSKDVFFNADERALFALVDTNLEQLVKLRDKVAHGECLDSQGGRIYNNFSPLISLLKILALWVIYRELGVIPKIIWRGIRDSRHRDVQGAKIDICRLSVMINDVPVFNVSKNTFNDFSKMQIPFFAFDTKTGFLVKKRKPQSKNTVCLSRILIECEKKYKMVCGAFIANYECVPMALQEKCEKWIS